jgi:predicted GNAT family acetyltransferase
VNVVRRNEERSRYELVADGQVIGVADYHVHGVTGALVFPHTEIDAALRGQGLGAQLVRGALDDVRARGMTVEPLCWFFAQFIDEHPEYQELVPA